MCVDRSHAVTRTRPRTHKLDTDRARRAAPHDHTPHLSDDQRTNGHNRKRATASTCAHQRFNQARELRIHRKQDREYNRRGAGAGQTAQCGTPPSTNKSSGATTCGRVPHTHTAVGAAPNQGRRLGRTTWRRQSFGEAAHSEETPIAWRATCSGRGRQRAAARSATTPKQSGGRSGRGSIV